jgi:serine/threonine protein phosphatase PrpC
MQVEKSNYIQTSAFGLAKGFELLSEDSFDVRIFENLTVAVLCDGVGGAKEGQKASQRVVNYLIESFELKPEAWDIPMALHQFILSINHILYSESIALYDKPEFLTTLAVVVIEGNRLYGANVGDSRVYLSRSGELFQLSIDHTLQEKNRSHILTKAMGLSERVEPYFFENNLAQDDYILLSSDGVYNYIDKNILTEKIPLFATGLVKYINRELHENLPDDTSAVVMKFLEPNDIIKKRSEELEIVIELKKDMVIDGFTLIEHLSQDHRTWLATNSDNRRYIIKFPPVEAVDSSEHLNLFIKEVWNAKRLNCKYFPKAIVPTSRTKRYYIIEAIDGANLEEYIAKNELDINETIDIAQKLLLASQYLLRMNLLHGDIKPENIVRSKDGEFYVVDFGSIVEIFSINSRAGTPSYLAPERFNGSSISEQSEIFAIGVTLYRLLTKKFPYGEIEPFQNPTFLSKPDDLSKINRNIPEWLNLVVMRMISKDKTIRYKHFSEVIFDIENSDKVKPIYRDDTPLIERDPLKFYKFAFWSMVAGNIAQLIWR